MAEAHFNLRISRLHCDNGREYISTDFKNHCETKGVKIEYTIR